MISIMIKNNLKLRWLLRFFEEYFHFFTINENWKVLSAIWVSDKTLYFAFKLQHSSNNLDYSFRYL